MSLQSNSSYPVQSVFLSSPHDTLVELQAFSIVAFQMANLTQNAALVLTSLPSLFRDMSFGGAQANFHAFYAILYMLENSNMATIPVDY